MCKELNDEDSMNNDMRKIVEYEDAVKDYAHQYKAPAIDVEKMNEDVYMIEPWMIEEKRIAHFKDVFSAAERAYEVGRERMLSYVVAQLDHRKDAVLSDMQELIKLVELLILERQVLVNENKRLARAHKSIAKVVNTEVLHQDIYEQLKREVKKNRLASEEKKRNEQEMELEGYADDSPD